MFGRRDVRGSHREGLVLPATNGEKDDAPQVPIRSASHRPGHMMIDRLLTENLDELLSMESDPRQTCFMLPA